jgi:hypothetical protein
MLETDDDDLPSVPELAAGGGVQNQVLRAVDREQSEELLKLARDHGVKEDDPLWLAILAVVRAGDLSKSIASAADRVESAARGLSKAMYEQATLAGRDMAASAGNGIKDAVIAGGQGVVFAVTAAAKKAVLDLQKATASLEKLGDAKSAAIVNTWAAALVARIEKEADARIRHKVARSVASVTIAFLLIFTLGAAAALGWADASGHLLPTAFALRSPTAARGGCGWVKGWSRPICPVRRYQSPF